MRDLKTTTAWGDWHDGPHPPAGVCARGTERHGLELELRLRPSGTLELTGRNLLQCEGQGVRTIGVWSDGHPDRIRDALARVGLDLAKILTENGLELEEVLGRYGSAVNRPR